MLQPNPVKRITLQEIQEHKWYRKDLPDYLHFISKQQMNNKSSQIDKQLVQELFKLNLNITKSFDEVCQDILNKRNTDYCGAYELMKHDKIKKECFKTNRNGESESPTGKKIGKLDNIQTILERSKDQEKDRENDALASSNYTTENKKQNDVIFSHTHQQRLNRINNKFKRRDAMFQQRQEAPQ